MDFETTGTLGARWFMTARGSATYAIHLGAFRTEWDGAPGQPNRTGYGLFAGLHQSRLSPSGVARSRARGLVRTAEAGTARWSSWGAGAPGDFWAGVALDSFSTEGRTDVGIGLERVCLDDPTNDLTVRFRRRAARRVALRRPHQRA